MKTYLIFRQYYNDDSGMDLSHVVKVVESPSDLRVNEYIDRLLQEEKEDYALQKECRNFWREVESRLEEDRKDDFRHDIKDIPKWKAGISMTEITPEMRKERDDIKAHNEEIHALYKKITEEIQVEVERECRARFATMGLPEDKYNHFFCRYRYYFKDFERIKYYAEEVEVETL